MRRLFIALMLCGIASVQAVQVTNSTLQATVANNAYVVLDVYADGCPPCNMLAPVFQAVEKELGNAYTFAKLNGRQEAGAASGLNVRGFPTLIFFKNGQEVGRQTGYVSHDQLINLTKRYFQ